MIVVQNNKETVGAVHITEDFDFVGFCLNRKDKISQKIDIYVNNQKIDTILCNISNSKLENIYDIEVSNSCFEYQLPSQYIKEDTILEFKYENTSESIVNSPIKFSEIKNFNKKLFLFSLKESDNEQLTYLDGARTLGFLATEENLKDEGFIRYIKRLLTDFPDIKFKAFYLEKELKPLIEDTFSSKVELFELKTISNICKNVSVLILNNSKPLDKSIINKCFIKGLYLSNYYPNLETTIEDSNNEHILKLLKNNYNLFSLSKDEIEKYNNHIFIHEQILLRNTKYENRGEFISDPKQKNYERNIKLMKIALNDSIFIDNTIEFRKNIFKLL